MKKTMCLNHFVYNSFYNLIMILLIVAISVSCDQGNKTVQHNNKENALYPVPDGVKLLTDIPYRDGNNAWMVDIAMPDTPSEKPRAAVLALHGGGWRSGDKNGQRPLILFLAKNGYIGVGVRYRLTGEAPFPACIEDVKCASRWLRAHADDYNVDPNKIGAMGHSAGAHLCAMLGVAGKESGLDTGPWQEYSSIVNAVCGIATPTDFPSMLKMRADRFESVEQSKQCSPITYVNANAPPFLLIHGTEDKTVRTSQPKSFVDALRTAGAENIQLVIFDNIGHDPMPPLESILRPMVLEFFNTTIGPDAGILKEQIAMENKWRALRRTEKRWDMEKFLSYDLDKNDRVSQDEFPGTDELFARIDRSFDGYINEADFNTEK